jgi:hypothetical protein
MVRNEQALHETFDRLLSDPQKCERMGQAAQAFMTAQNGVLSAVLSHLRPTLLRAEIRA